MSATFFTRGSVHTGSSIPSPNPLPTPEYANGSQILATRKGSYQVDRISRHPHVVFTSNMLRHKLMHFQIVIHIPNCILGRHNCLMLQPEPSNCSQPFVTSFRPSRQAWPALNSADLQRIAASSRLWPWHDKEHSRIQLHKAHAHAPRCVKHAAPSCMKHYLSRLKGTLSKESKHGELSDLMLLNLPQNPIHPLTCPFNLACDVAIIWISWTR